MDRKQCSGGARKQWNTLTDDELGKVAGRREQPAGRIQESNGINSDEAERQMEDWESQF